MMLTCLSTYIGHVDGSMEFAHKHLPGLHKANRIC
jgi:branched-subunit amino acid permease